MNRVEKISQIKKSNWSGSGQSNVESWDILIIGGGATGLGIALDATLRGLKVLLLEKGDFASETSSQSTKLIHGGVRYLKNFDLKSLVESAEEQVILRNQAPHLVTEVDFILPTPTIFQHCFYRIGFLIFDLLSIFAKRKYNFPLNLSKSISLKSLKKYFPTLSRRGIFGGIRYADCQFDDARFAYNLFEKASKEGANILNYCKVEKFIYTEDKISGVSVTDEVTKETFHVNSKIIINATGSQTDFLIHLDQPKLEKIIDPVQGIHIVVSLDFLKGQTALIIPKTKRNRVFYAIPWMNVLLIGTTETRLDLIESSEPRQDEIDYLLEEFSLHFDSKPQRSDILSVFCGIRPLIKADHSDQNKFVSREHAIFTAPSGLITIAGGKWTTYRKMGEDAVNLALELGQFIKIPSKTSKYKFIEKDILSDIPVRLKAYGDSALEILKLEKSNTFFAELIHEELPYSYSQIFWAIHHEHVVHVDDVLLRRTRALYLNAKATIEVAPKIIAFMAKELNLNQDWIESELYRFAKISEKFTLK